MAISTEALVGTMKLREAYPKVNTNFENVKDEVNPHFAGTGNNHNATAITFGASDVNAELINLQSQLDVITVADSNATIGVYSLDATGIDTITATYTDLTYFAGLKINLKIADYNTGAVTFNLNNLGPKIIYKVVNGIKTNLKFKDFQVNTIYGIEYDGIDFILINTSDSNSLLFNNQSDFIELIKSKSSYEKVAIRRQSTTQFETIAYSGNRGVSYQFVKNNNDDFHILGLCELFEFNGIKLEIDSDIAELGDLTGTWTTVGDNWYATAVDSTVTLSVKGDSIYFKHFGDDRGGIFEFVIDGNVLNPIKISTYRASGGTVYEVLIVKNLKNVVHSVVATFKGDDPLNTPSGGVGTSRGWLRVGTEKTLKGYLEKGDAIPYATLSHPSSNKEMAINVTVGASSDYWIPDHGVGTVFTNNVGEIVGIFIDDEEIDVGNMIINDWVEASKISLVQNATVTLPDGIGNIANLKFNHTVNLDGIITYSGFIEFTQETIINTAYPLMIPTNGGILDTFVTGINNSLVSSGDDSTLYFTDEKDRNINVSAVNSINNLYMMAGKILTPYKTMRMEDTIGKPILNQDQFVWQRAIPPKYYFTSIKSLLANIGYKYSWSAQIGIINTPNIFESVI